MRKARAKTESWFLGTVPPKRDVSGKNLKAKLWKQLWKFTATVLPTEVKTSYQIATEEVILSHIAFIGLPWWLRR